MAEHVDVADVALMMNEPRQRSIRSCSMLRRSAMLKRLSWIGRRHHLEGRRPLLAAARRG